MDNSHDPDGLGDSGELDDGGRRDLPDARPLRTTQIEVACLAASVSSASRQALDVRKCHVD